MPPTPRNMSPQFAFIGRLGQALDIANEKISEKMVVAAVAEAAAAMLPGGCLDLKVRWLHLKAHYPCCSAKGGPAPCSDGSFYVSLGCAGLGGSGGAALQCSIWRGQRSLRDTLGTSRGSPAGTAAPARCAS